MTIPQCEFKQLMLKSTYLRGSHQDLLAHRGHQRSHRSCHQKRDPRSPGAGEGCCGPRPHSQSAVGGSAAPTNKNITNKKLTFLSE